MINLYWKTDKQNLNLIPAPFKSENEFEEYVFENQDFLGDVYIIHRQIRTGNKHGIPDMLGVDKDARVCIIEMKNEQANEDVLPQVLQYAIWAETQPDSIKAIWLESENKPEEIELDWDNLEIRILVVAPSFRATVPRMAGKIGYPIDLIQIQRFSFEQDEFVLVDVLEEERVRKVISTKVLGDWDWEFYEKEHGSKATKQFQRAVIEIQKIVESRGWEMKFNLNKYYTGFKLGGRVAFSVNWGGTHAWNVCCKLPLGEYENPNFITWEFQRYDAGFKEAVFRPLDRDVANLMELEEMLVAAYKHISGGN